MRSSARPMLIVDTGPIVALLNRNDPDHNRCAELLESHNGELLITPYVLTEARYLLAKYVGPDAEINLIEAVAAEDLVQAGRPFPHGRTHAAVPRISSWCCRCLSSRPCGAPQSAHGRHAGSSPLPCHQAPPRARADAPAMRPRRARRVPDRAANSGQSRAQRNPPEPSQQRVSADQVRFRVR